MASVKTSAIVLRHAPYRDNDRMLTLFSPTLGRVDALCRGCRKQKSPLMAASELFCAGEYLLYQNGDRMSVSACEVQDSFYPLRSDFERLAHGTLYLELCESSVQSGQGGQGNERLFLFLLRTLAHLCYSTCAPERVSAIFLIGFMSLIGFRPRLNACMQCGEILPQAGRMLYFDQLQGGVLCSRCGAGGKHRIGPDALIFMQKVMKSGLAVLEESEPLEPGVLKLLIDYAQDRMDKVFRSAKFLL